MGRMSDSTTNHPVAEGGDHPPAEGGDQAAPTTKGADRPRGRLRSVEQYDRELARIKRLRARAEARQRRARDQAAKAERRKHTRRLCTLAGALLAQARDGDTDVRRLIEAVLQRPDVREVFEGWDAPWEATE